MKTSAMGIALIQQFEGCILKAYPDPATGGDPWTIGYGHTGPEVKPGLVIGKDQATTLLRADLAKFEAVVSKAAPVATQAQFDAMVSLCFNIGPGNFLKSTLLKKHQQQLYGAAAAQFAVWNKAAGRVMAGLTRRRAAEAKLYRGDA